MGLRLGRRRAVAGMFGVFLGFTAARLEASPIELSTVLNGVSLTGTSNDSPVAFDCLPGAVCLPVTERAFSFKIGASDLDLELVLIPDLEPDLAAMLKQIDDDATMNAAEKEQAKFALLRSATATAPVDKELENLAVKVPLSVENVAKYTSSLTKGSSEYFEYMNKVGFKEGYNPKGAALIISEPGAKEGRAVVIGNEIPVPEPGSLTLIGVGLAGLLWKRRARLAVAVGLAWPSGSSDGSRHSNGV